MRDKGGFIAMVLSVIGIVLYCALFPSIFTALETIRTYANIATFTALETIVKITPTVLLLGGLLGASFGYFKGYQSVAGKGSDPGGLIRMVMGVLVIILFVTLFSTILTSMYTLYSHASAGNYTAFQTITQIVPTILFLGGIFAGASTTYGGFKARKRRKGLRIM